MPSNLRIKNAIVSVSDKTNLVSFAKKLIEKDINIYSTGGTLKVLQEAGLEVTSIEQYTDSAEMFDGRVKTLHPKIHGGILARSDNESDLATLEKYNIANFELVCVNLYPFEKVVNSFELVGDEELKKAIENIDIGGPAMIRAAAKNYSHTAVVIDISQYSLVEKELENNDACIGESLRLELCNDAFSRISQYDSRISEFMNMVNEREIPEIHNLGLKKAQSLRYGENPHQKGGFYIRDEKDIPWKQLHGKELSYNNLLDMDAALKIGSEFSNVCAIFKHTNPCGLATGGTQLENLTRAIETDNVSYFGGIAVFSEPVEKTTAKKLSESFFEMIVAPAYHEDAFGVLSKKKNLRLIETKFCKSDALEIRSASSGYLVQEPDQAVLAKDNINIVTKTKPSDADIEELLFAFKSIKFIKSNAIVFTKKGQTLGIGAGQMSRIDSMQFAIAKASKAKLSLAGSFLGSDAFFPFRDVVDEAAKLGVKGIIQPGGSIRDEESIAAADEAGIMMVFTASRHFRY